MYQVTVINLQTGEVIVNEVYDNVVEFKDDAAIRVPDDDTGNTVIVPTGVRRLMVQAYSGTDSYENYTAFVDETIADGGET